MTTSGTASVNVSASDSGGTGTASTSFNVSAPSVGLTAKESIPVQAHLALGFGPYSVSSSGSGQQGIIFTGTGGSGGSLSFAQIVTANSWTIVDNNGARTTKQKKPNLPGLDKSFPYPPESSSNPGVTSDSPILSVTSGNQVTLINQNSWSATMYLLWTSSKSNALPIPVMSISWGWSANGTYNANTGNPIGVSYSSPPPSLSGKAYSSGVLTWTQTTKAGDVPIPGP